MSHDRVWLCPSLKRETWVEFQHARPRQASELEGLPSNDRFSVSVSAGQNVLVDELYVFSNEQDARQFYDHDVQGREFLDDKGNGVGFDHIFLYVDGELVAGRIGTAADGPHSVKVSPGWPHADKSFWFTNEQAARHFYESGYRNLESFPDGWGEVFLFVDGKCVASRIAEPAAPTASVDSGDVAPAAATRAVFTLGSDGVMTRAVRHLCRAL